MKIENMKRTYNPFLSITIRKKSYLNVKEGSYNNELIPLRNVYHSSRINCENEWNQEYYIIYNSYILEEKEG